MINYIIQVLLFQTLFLAVYDFFLQKETFFKWNRLYLLGTPILSIIIPLLKFDSIKSTVPQEYIVMLPEVMLNPQAVIEKTVASVTTINYVNLLFYIGVTLFLILFLLKLMKIIKVISSNRIIKKDNYKLVLLEGKQSAFSFFNYIFIDQKLIEKKELQIIQHELVHSKQLHTLDLLFFEIFKIVMWFNPMLYIYQKRIAELHEYISDAEVVKASDKKTYFNKLLSETFRVENISFVNQFYKQSFIKKRITMITKNKSQKMKQLKYLLLIPVLASMLLYSSCETNDLKSVEESVAKKELSTVYMNEGDTYRSSTGSKETYFDTYILFNNQDQPNIELLVLDYKDLIDEEKAEFEDVLARFKKLENKNVSYELSLYKLKNGRKIIVHRMNMERKEKEEYSYNEDVPFAIIDKAPIFPGCEDSDNLKDCLNTSLRNFVVANFNADLGKNLGLEPGKQKIYVQFKITKNGTVEILGARAAHKDLEAEARRVVNLLPKMIPGEQKGKPVNVTYMLPISFMVDGVVEEDDSENSKGKILATVEYRDTGEMIYYVEKEKVTKEEYERVKLENERLRKKNSQ
ncbi:MAG: M56 family metallopeptidase [Flavobacteriaceae bacterium]